MARYLTRQRKQLLEYLSEHTDEQMTARQIADALTAESISISAVYRNLSALEEEGILKRSIRENTREVYYQYIAAEGGAASAEHAGKHRLSNRKNGNDSVWRLRRLQKIKE